MMLTVLGYLALVALGFSHWMQVYKIHKHREVRDLSGWTYILLLIGYTVLGIKATVDWYNGSGPALWIFKQLATIVPAATVVWQIKVHSKDEWHDDEDKSCCVCGNELEPHWKFCADCGTSCKDQC